MAETMGGLASLLFLGFFLGMRHATDADHVIAIATIVSRQRTVRGSALIGAAWGAGHTLTILIVGGAIVLFGVVIPPRIGLAMEFSVGLMLVAAVGLLPAVVGATLQEAVDLIAILGALRAVRAGVAPVAGLDAAPRSRGTTTGPVPDAEASLSTGPARPPVDR